uniref:Centromere protein O n=1 Tax=Pelusios castaneus TaxID=367368 RepID=A0A8C8S4Z4_9SAUR
EAYARKLARKQEETEQQQEKLAQLRARIEELRLQRDELQTKVNLQQVGVRVRCLPDVEPVQAAETRDRALLEWKVENAKAMLQAFYLTGISGKLTKHGACFCISTAYEGTYLDSYYLDLLMQQPVQIRRHSVPVFIPLEQIAKKYLQTDIKCFLATLSEHLNAYAGRKYQADQLQVLMYQLCPLLGHLTFHLSSLVSPSVKCAMLQGVKRANKLTLKLFEDMLCKFQVHVVGRGRKYTIMYFV